MGAQFEFNNRVEILSKGGLSQPAWVRIDQQEYLAQDHDPKTILVLESVAQELLLQDLPTGIALTPCKRLQPVDLTDLEINEGLDIPFLPSRFEGIAPFKIFYLGKGRAGIILSWHCTKDFWSNQLGYRWKLEKARKAVLARRRSLGAIRFHQFKEDGYLAGVEFVTMTRSTTLEMVINFAYDLSSEINSIIEDVLRGTTVGKSNELSFIRESFIPLLRNLGFNNVIFHHGTREFGRDVLFSRTTEFGIPEYWAAQVKLGNVSGKSNSYLDLIANQALEAFKMPLYDLQTKSKVWISKFVVAITGRFTENAVEKICEKFEIHAQRNNILFLDGEKLAELSKGPL